MNKVIKSFSKAALLWLLFSPVLAQTTAPFDNEIKAFEKQDSLTPPSKGGIVLWGSSTFRLWKTAIEDLSGYPVTNRGFGGSQTEHAILYFERAVLPLAPKLLLIYEGDNDLSSKKTPEKVFEDFQTLVKLVHEKLPKTRIAFCSIRPSLARETLMPEQEKVNAWVQKYCKKHKKYLDYVNIRPLLLDANGKPNGDLLITDKLHLNAKGYEIWTKATREYLVKVWKK
ncbi:MAG: GDSL-type esterase/lipase family protein [Spirosomataceae bacterium]